MGSFKLDLNKNISNQRGEVEREREERCPNSRLYARVIDHGFDDEEDLEELVFIRCKKWDCPFCSKINAFVFRAKVRRAVQHILIVLGITPAKLGYLFKFLTLTVPGNEFRSRCAPEDAEILLKANWNRLVTALRRRYGEFYFCWVCETQQDGYPHLHVLLIGRALAEKEVQDYIEKLWRGVYGMGFIKLKLARSLGGVTWYLTKYMSKGMASGRDHSKVYSMSREFQRAAEVGRVKRQFTVLEYGSFCVTESGEYLFNPIKVNDLSPIVEDVMEAFQELEEYFKAKRYGQGEQILLL